MNRLPALLALALVLTAVAATGPEVARHRAEQLLEALAGGPEADLSAFVVAHVSGRLREKFGDEELARLLGHLGEDLGGGELPLLALSDTGDGYRLETRNATGEATGVKFWLAEDDENRTDGFAPAPGPAAPREVPRAELPERIDAFIDERAGKGLFSGVVLVALDGEPIFAGAWGLADRDSGRRNSLATPFNLGSMNKMFTGLAAGQLAARGELDYAATVGRYLPQYPNETVRDEVTVHQLLTHTSGIPSYWNDAYEAGKDEIDTLAGFAATFSGQPLRFEPGTGNEYSNGGPVVLGLIIEAVTGKSHYEVVQQAIFGPAGMTDTAHFRRDDTESGIARGYGRPDPEGPWVDNAGPLGIRGSAAGGGYATATDLLAFSRALAAGTLLERDALEVLWSPPRKGPELPGYGYLWGTGRVNGHRWVGHNGGAPGVSADYRYYPEANATVIVLANQSRAAMPVSEWINDLVSANGIPASGS